MPPSGPSCFSTVNYRQLKGPNAVNTVRVSHLASLQQCSQRNSARPCPWPKRQQARVGRPLPGLVQAAGEPLGLHFVPVDENPHPGIDIEHGSVGTEGAPLWLPGGGRKEECCHLPHNQPEQEYSRRASLQALRLLTSHLSFSCCPGGVLPQCGHHILPPLTSPAQAPDRHLPWPYQCPTMDTASPLPSLGLSFFFCQIKELEQGSNNLFFWLGLRSILNTHHRSFTFWRKSF